MLYHCSLEALFLPSTVKEIGDFVLINGLSIDSMRLLILPNDIKPADVGVQCSLQILFRTVIEQIAGNIGVEHDSVNGLSAYEDSNRRINEWLIHYMDESPFHKL